jgi:fructose-1,6-bisphosphatase/inositol monophosphatase family enzyme
MRFTAKDHGRLADILAEAARREVMPRFRRLASGDVRAKSAPDDLVTEADEAAERFIAAAVETAFPGAVMVGEEGATRDPSLLARLAGADLAVIVDPIDGTLNYASDLPLFAVMAAVVVRGEIVASVIHDPVVEDSAMALRGEGAFLRLADGTTRDLRVCAGAAPAAMTAMMSWRYFPQPQRDAVPACFPAFANVASLRCCAHEYRLAAAGKVHVLLYGRLNPWDHAPGVLLHTEAGGHARLLDGSEYRVDRPATGLLCAPDAESWQAAREVLRGVG